MGLGLLVPLFLLGLAGVVIPIIVHLTRRQRRNVVRFPSLMFLSRIPFREQRRRRLRHLFLLSLRLLALAAVVAAFTRPFVEDEDVDGFAGGGPREVVILVDRSYSMEAQEGFAEAVGRARSLVAGLGPLDRASLVYFDRRADVAVRSSLDPRELERALEEASIGSGATRFGPALRVAASVIEESALPMGEVFLISDFQRSGWSDDDRALMPVKALVTPVPVGAGRIEGEGAASEGTSPAEDALISAETALAPTENAVIPPSASDVTGEGTSERGLGGGEDRAITGVSLARSAEGGRERVTATARLAHLASGSSADESPAVVSLSVDGDEVERVEVRFAPDGTATVSFRPFTLSLPYTRGEVALASSDALSANDIRRFVASPGGSISILIAENPASATDASLFLRRALEISADARFDVEFRSSSSLGDADLERTDVVILNDLRPGVSSLSRLSGFVDGGGGVVIALGPSSNWQVGEGWTQLPGRVGALRDREAGRAGRLGLLDYSHPALQAFAGPRSGDFTGSRFFRSRDLAPSDSAEVLMHFDDGSPALVEGRFGEGRVLVWASTLDTYWNDLALQPVFLPFVHGLVEHASGRAETVVEFSVGQLFDLDDPEALESAGAPAPEAIETAGQPNLIAIAPSGEALQIPDEGATRFISLDESGFYSVREQGTDPERPFSLAVNVEIAEGNLAGMDPEELVARISGSTVGDERPGASDGSAATGSSATGSAAAGDAATGGALQMRRADRERRQSLWRWLLIGALALLVVETFVANRSSATAGADVVT